MQANHLPLLQDSRPAAQDHADRAPAVLRLRGDAPVLGLAEEDRAGHCAAQEGGVNSPLSISQTCVKIDR